jgi:hypothetical protein
MHEPAYRSDYESVARNGIGYTREVSGYRELLRKGYPEPAHPETVLLELRLPDCPPVLWATGGFAWIPVKFVAREDFIGRLLSAGVTGFETCPVEVVKVASRGRRRATSTGGPEDQVLRSRNILDVVRGALSTLFGVRITGTVPVQPEEELTADDPRVRRYDFVGRPRADLCYPTYRDERYGGHVFCTRRVVDLVDDKSDNVAFTPFDEWAAEMWPR